MDGLKYMIVWRWMKRNSNSKTDAIIADCDYILVRVKRN